MGYWLPWDPLADKVQNEEYLEEELNTLMKEYKENEVRKDMFYEEQKREKTQAAVRERLEAEEKKRKQETMNTSVEVDGEENKKVAQLIVQVSPFRNRFMVKVKFEEAPQGDSSEQEAEGCTYNLDEI